MRRPTFVPLALSLSLAAAPALAQEPTAADTLASDTALRRELLEMRRLDQQVRDGLTAESMRDTAVGMRMLRADSLLTRRLREIVARRGWPGKTLAGIDGADAAFLVVQHSPELAFQKEALERMRALPAGEVMPQWIALLTDRVRVDEGVPQLYGSQFRVVDGRMVPYPIEDEARVDERRAAMGLPSMAEYARMLEEMYKAPTETRPPPQPR
jgi:hypothetical protein